MVPPDAERTLSQNRIAFVVSLSESLTKTQARPLPVGGTAERAIVQDPLIRDACRSQQLAIVFSRAPLTPESLQEFLATFAEQSGYDELPVAPLFFHGHSAGGPAAKRLAIAFADRCFGLMQFRGGIAGNGNPADPSLPAGIPNLAMLGQFDEFGGTMRDADGREGAWMGARDALAAWRHREPGALASIAVEPGSSHFAWSEINARYLALFIATAAEKMIPPTWQHQPELLDLDVNSGWMTSFDVGKHNICVAADAWDQATHGVGAWHLNEALARASLNLHADLFGKQDQFLNWQNDYWVDAGTRFFFKRLTWEEPGDVFHVHPVFRSEVPGQFNDLGPIWLTAGTEVGNSASAIELKTVSGPLRKVDGGDQFQLYHDTLTPVFGRRERLTFMAYNAGDDTFRHTEQVGMAPRDFKGFRKGAEQVISFPALPDLSSMQDQLLAGYQLSLFANGAILCCLWAGNYC